MDDVFAGMAALPLRSRRTCTAPRFGVHRLLKNFSREVCTFCASSVPSTSERGLTSGLPANASTLSAGTRHAGFPLSSELRSVCFCFGLTVAEAAAASWTSTVLRACVRVYVCEGEGFVSEIFRAL